MGRENAIWRHAQSANCLCDSENAIWRHAQSANCLCDGQSGFYVACSLSAPSVAGTFYPASAPRPVINDAALGAGLDGYDQSEACEGLPVERPVGGWNAENSHAYYLR